MPAPRLEHVRPVARGSVAACRAGARSGRSSIHRGGFSLLELIVVMAIASAAASVGLLKYSGSVARYRVDASSRRIIADVQRAQAEARSSSSSRTLEFIPGRGAYRVRTEAEVVADTAGDEVLLIAEPYRASIQLFGMPGNTVKFDGYGWTQTGGIVAVSSGGASLAVHILPGSGRAYVAGTE